jgi:hypothetical protein
VCFIAFWGVEGGGEEEEKGEWRRGGDGDWGLGIDVVQHIQSMDVHVLYMYCP